MKKYFQKNIFISLYLLFFILYSQLKWNVYKGILIEFKSIFLFLSIASLIYSVVLKDKFIKIFYGINVLIVLIFIGGFLLLKPQYTYSEAKDILIAKENFSGNIIDNNNNPNNRKIGLNVLKVYPRKNLLIDGDYIFYVEGKEKIVRYRFDSLNGKITVWK